MRVVWRWTLLVAVLALAGTMGFSVFAHQPTPTTMQVEVPKEPYQLIATFYPVRGDLDIPKGGRYRPSQLVVTWDGSQWHAFSNRTDPYGCEVEYKHVTAWQYGGANLTDVLYEVCHGAVYNFTGLNIGGPHRTLYAYPVRQVKPGTLEVDLGRPTPTFK